jgi:hypothetical protein
MDMKYTSWAAIISLVATLHLHAQTPASQTGPSMEQTIAFINDVLAREGEGMVFPNMRLVSRNLVLQKDCSVLSRTTYFQTVPPEDPSAWRNGEVTGVARLRLDQSDPLTVSIKKVAGLAEVSIEKGVLESEYPTVASSAQPVDLTGSAVLIGKIQSFVAPELVLLSGDTGKLLRFQVGPTARVFFLFDGGSSTGATLNDLVPGAVVYLDQKMIPNADGKGHHQLGTHLEHTISIYRPPTKPTHVVPFTFSDQETAEHVAKALIHAMVLCHRDVAPPLF